MFERAYLIGMSLLIIGWITAAVVGAACIPADQAERNCARSTVTAVESAVQEVSADHLEKCKAAIDKVASRWRATCTRPQPERDSCFPDPCNCEIRFVGGCEDPPPCRWDDIDLGKLSKWRICAGLIAREHARWTKDNCDPMPCHCQ